jgi:hypothetical protein
MGEVSSEHAVLDLLVERGARDIDHPGGTLLQHLHRVGSLLEQWGATIEVQTAGLCHACYGTDGFAPALLSLRERAVLQARVGATVEAWVYLHASCDRAFVYRELATVGPLRFRDRFTGETSVIDDDDAAVLAELTAANELDIVTANPEWGAEIGPELFSLMRSARHRLSAPAWDGWVSAIDVASGARSAG